MTLGRYKQHYMGYEKKESNPDYGIMRIGVKIALPRMNFLSHSA